MFSNSCAMHSHPAFATPAALPSTPPRAARNLSARRPRASASASPTPAPASKKRGRATAAALFAAAALALPFPVRAARAPRASPAPTAVVASGGGGRSVGFGVAASAALIGSTLSVLLCHPIDTIKTKKQAAEMDGLAQAGAAPTGLRGLYTGVWSNVAKEAPNAAIYLGCYEIFKVALMGTPLGQFPLAVFCLAGMLGDAIGSVVRVPAEVVNKKLQLRLAKDWKTAARESFLTQAGREQTFASWKAVALRDVPYGGLQIAMYEAFRLPLKALIPAGLLADVIAGALAGLIAAFVTTPADVLVTRLSAQAPQCYLETGKFMGPLSTAKRVIKDDGFMGLWSGAFERGLYYAPLIGVFFACYEMAKWAILFPNAALAMVLRAGGVLGGAGYFLAAAVLCGMRQGGLRRMVAMFMRAAAGVQAVRQTKRRNDKKKWEGDSMEA